MPFLSFDDVFSPDKANIINTVNELDKVNKGYGIVIVYLMKKYGLDELTVPRKEFANLLPDEENGGVSLSMSSREDRIEVRLEDSE